MATITANEDLKYNATIKTEVSSSSFNSKKQPYKAE